MKTATVRDLRNHFPTLEAWMAEGEQIEIRKRGKAIARLVPVSQTAKAKFVLPDFEARLKTLWGDRVLSASEVKAMREAELEGEDG